MKMIDLIYKKKNGESHSITEIEFLINGIKKRSIPDYQLSAWLMAVCINGMSFDENAALTYAMANSGKLLDLSRIGNYIIDKHSTGGVGDKTTLILVPLLAAAGLPVAKLSGRGLGYTGGTIDKLESIPGFKTALSLKEFIRQVKTIGAAIASQTTSLAPADGKLYALRDVTGTVESIPLIASSVMSKKIASGANIIVLDIKCGNGAFIKCLEDAETLSKTMVEIGKRLDKSVSAVITSMDQPLGNAIGNSLEVIESINTLRGSGPKDLTELSIYLCAISVVKANLTDNIEEAKDILYKCIENGSAIDKFKEIITAQGGDASIVDNLEKLPVAKYKFEFKSEIAGYIQELDALKIAKVCKLLGAGRNKKDDRIDNSVGIVLTKKIGDKINSGEVLAEVFAGSENSINSEIMSLLQDAYKFSDEIPAIPELIYKTIL